MVSRQQKVEALKQLMKGTITPDQLPKPEPESSMWHFNGELYIRLQPATKQPHPSGTQLNADAFCLHAGKRPELLHVVLDSSGNVKPGDISLEEIVEDDAPETGQAVEGSARVVRIGVVLPSSIMFPVKASQWQQAGCI